MNERNIIALLRANADGNNHWNNLIRDCADRLERFLDSPVSPAPSNKVRRGHCNPHTLEHFPEGDLCPICGTNDDGKTVLVPVSGTEQGSICEAKPMHLACAVAKQWDTGMGLGFTWPVRAKAESEQSKHKKLP